MDHNQRLIEQRNELESQRLHNKGMYENIFNLVNDLKNEVDSLKGQVASLTTELDTIKDRNQEQERLINKVSSMTKISFSSDKNNNNKHGTSTPLDTPGNTTNSNITNENKSSGNSESEYTDISIC